MRYAIIRVVLCDWLGRVVGMLRRVVQWLVICIRSGIAPAMGIFVTVYLHGDFAGRDIWLCCRSDGWWFVDRFFIMRRYSARRLTFF